MQRPSLEYAQRPVDVYRSNDNESISDPIYNLICSFNPSPPKKKGKRAYNYKVGPHIVLPMFVSGISKWSWATSKVTSLLKNSNHLVKRPSHWLCTCHYSKANPANDCYVAMSNLLANQTQTAGETQLADQKKTIKFAKLSCYWWN